MALVLLGLVLYFAIAEIFIRRIITGNMMLFHLYEDIPDGVERITALLKALIGATTRNGMCYDQWGIWLNPLVGRTNFANACYLIFPSLFVLLVPILSGGIWITKAFGKYRQKPIIEQQNTSRVKKITHGIAIVVIYLLTAEAYISRLITGNLMLRKLASLHGYGGAGETLSGIISFLKTLIGAGDGITTMDQFGIGLYAFASRNLMSVCYLIVPSLFMLVTPIVAGINYVIRVMRKNASNNE